MLPDTLSIIKENILNKKLSERKTNQFIKTLSLYDGVKHKYLYPGVIIRKVGITMNDCYTILDEIEKLNIIVKVFEVFCPRCKYSTGEFYNNIKELPDEASCDHCENEFNPLAGVIILYKVIPQ